MSDTIMAKGISKSFKRGTETIHAIQDISLNVGKGEMLSIMGRSGSGKTTLLSCIGMLENIDSGSLALEGRNIKDFSEAQRTVLRRELMGFVFQRFFLIPTLTAYENVALPGLFAGKKLGKDHIMELLEMVGVSQRYDHRPGQMSGGEMQRVAIARALALDPPILIADEPTGNLDTETAEAVFGLFKKLAGQGKTIIIATHSQKLAKDCDRVVELMDGRITRDEKN